MKDQKIKIFVINLKRSVERREKIENALQSIGLEYEIIPAVDGKCLTEEQKALCDLQEQNILPLSLGKKVYMEDALSPGEIGCALSHLSIYQKILDSDLDYACIIEDDNLVSPCFLELMEGVEHYKDQWDIVNYSDHSSIRGLPWSKKFVFGTKPNQYLQREGFHSKVLDTLFNARRCCFKTNCYFIKRQACKTLLELGYPVKFPSDTLTGHVAHHGLRLFRCYPCENHYYGSWDNVGSEISERPKHKIRSL